MEEWNPHKTTYYMLHKLPSALTEDLDWFVLYDCMYSVEMLKYCQRENIKWMGKSLSPFTSITIKPSFFLHVRKKSRINRLWDICLSKPADPYPFALWFDLFLTWWRWIMDYLKSFERIIRGFAVSFRKICPIEGWIKQSNNVM